MGMTEEEATDLVDKTTEALDNFDEATITDEMFALIMLKSFQAMPDVTRLVGMVFMGIYGEDRVGKVSEAVEIIVNATQSQALRKSIIDTLNSIGDVYDTRDSGIEKLIKELLK